MTDAELKASIAAIVDSTDPVANKATFDAVADELTKRGVAPSDVRELVNEAVALALEARQASVKSTRDAKRAELRAAGIIK